MGERGKKRKKAPNQKTASLSWVGGTAQYKAEAAWLCRDASPAIRTKMQLRKISQTGPVT